MKPLGHKRLIEYELEGFGIRLNKEPPNIYFKRKDKGGLNYQALVPQSSLDLETVKAILGEYKIHNAVRSKFQNTKRNISSSSQGYYLAL